jgi:cell division transport system permease protein
MPSHHLRRALQDIRSNRLLNAVAVGTIALSILIITSAMLFFRNADEILNSWQEGVRITAYLADGLASERIAALEQEIGGMEGVSAVRFVSKEEGLQALKAQMEHQGSILENLRDNPLPDALDIRLTAAGQSAAALEGLAAELDALEGIEAVEYGQRWIGRVARILDLFRLVGYTMGGLFFVAAVFIVGNTIRLTLYSRREEVEIMRLVGATDRFIMVPFYLQSMIQGALGGVMGLGALLVMYALLQARLEEGLRLYLLNMRFLPPGMAGAVVLGSMIVGCLGCHLSLRQYLKA